MKTRRKKKTQSASNYTKEHVSLLKEETKIHTILPRDLSSQLEMLDRMISELRKQLDYCIAESIDVNYGEQERVADILELIGAINAFEFFQ